MATQRQSIGAIAGRGIRSALLGVLINLALSITKCIVGMFGHSFALIADGIESLSDVVSSSVVAFGLWLAIQPPDENHPYGHGKAEPVAAVVVSAALIAAGFAIAIESVLEIRRPHRLPAPYTLYVLVAVVLIKLVLSRYVRGVGTDINSTAIRADAWHHLSDALTSAFAFVGISVGLFTGNAAADDWAALCAAPIIVFNGFRQLRAPLAELLDEAPPADIERTVREVAATVRGVAGLDKCFVRKMGLQYYVDLHVLVDGRIPVTAGHQIAHEVESTILAAAPEIADVLVHIEPTEATRY